MHVWLTLCVLGAIAVVLFSIAVRAGFRIARMTVERNPELRPTNDLNAISAWRAARMLERLTDEIRRHAEADHEIRRVLRLQRLCYVGAGIFAVLPIIYAALVIDTLAR